MFEHSIISGYSQVIRFCKKQTLTSLRRYLALLHMVHKPKAGDACETCMAKKGKGGEFLSGPRRTKSVYVWSKRGRWIVLRCILKEMDLSDSGCVLVVNCCGNGDKMSDSIKEGNV